MKDRVFNFSAGPAVMPVSVLEQVQREMLSLPGVGMSVLEITHRGPTFENMLHSAAARLKALLNISSDYELVFLQGGSRLQFSMIPMNLLRGTGKSAEYIITGSWGKSALKEAQREGEVRVVWDGAKTKYDRLPTAAELKFNPDAAYVHITSNETIEGVQFPTDVGFKSAPVVNDCSSDFLSRPIPVEKYGIVYACAQKNAGPAGLTIVIIRKDLLAKGSDDLPGYLNYRSHSENDSMWNTPPTFAVYVFDLVAKWLQEDVGGLAKMEERNRAKAKLLYDAIDGSGGFYRPHAQPDCRSQMNVTFRLPSEDVEKQFLKEAEKLRLVNLKGHRSVGGIRASIYNAMPAEGVQTLAAFMKEFAKKNG